MGNELKEEHKVKAKQIREDLCQRVNRFVAQHQPQLDKIPQEKKKLITSSCATELTELMDNGELTSEEITLTFIQRTAALGLRNNYVIDEIF